MARLGDIAGSDAAGCDLNAIRIDPALLEEFASTMRENTSGFIPFRKAYLQSLISVIEIDDTGIRIKGSRDVLEKTVLASRNGAVPGSQMSTGWRSLEESNPCFRRKRAASKYPPSETLPCLTKESLFLAICA